MAQDATGRKLFFDVQKKDYSKCLYGALDCKKKAIRAHSIQNARVLDLIEEKGHVLAPRHRIGKDGEAALEFAKVGRNEASTFTGLCAEHDAELFKLIDTAPLNVDNIGHLNLLTYRSVMREMHARAEASSRLWSLHEALLVERGLPPDADAATAASLLALQFDERSWRVFRYRCKHFDNPADAGLQPDLVHVAIDLPKQAPVIAVSSLFSTGHTDGGDLIGPTLNVVPLDKQNTVAILSCPFEQVKQVTSTLANVLRAGTDEKFKRELSKLIIQRAENFVVSPAHFASWSAEKQKRVLDDFQRCLYQPVELEDHKDLMLF